MLLILDRLALPCDFRSFARCGFFVSCLVVASNTGNYVCPHSEWMSYAAIVRETDAQSATRFRRSALAMTDTELRLMAAAASIGLNCKPKVG